MIWAVASVSLFLACIVLIEVRDFHIYQEKIGAAWIRIEANLAALECKSRLLQSNYDFIWHECSKSKANITRLEQATLLATKPKPRKRPKRSGGHAKKK